MNYLTDKHIYEGNIMVCLKCFKSKSDPIHLILRPDESRVAPDALNDLPSVVPEERILHSALPPHPDLTKNDKDHTVFAEPAKKTVCKGHECTNCGATWHHTDTLCSGKNVKARCPGCAAQQAIEIGRPVEIEQIAQLSGSALTGAETVEITAQHDKVVWNKTHDQTGKLRENWQLIVHEHRRDLQKLMDEIKCKINSESRMRPKLMMESISHLSPEEKEQYARDAARQKKSKAAKNGSGPEKKEPKEALDPKKLWDKMVKELGNEIRAKRPGLSDDEVIRLAEKKKRMLDAMDAE